jgi:chemotaxis protein CheX
MYTEEIEKIAQTVFATMFEIDLFRLESATIGDSDPLQANVSIAGAWSGCVALSLSSGLIQAAASKMLNCDPNALTNEDQQEVATEIANMIGGNLKSILPAPSILSIPQIVPNDERSRQEGNSSDELTFGASEGFLRVSVYT